MSAPSASERDLTLVRALVEQGAVRSEQIQECLRLLSDFAEFGLSPLPTIEEMLLKKRWVTPEAIERARAALPVPQSVAASELPPEVSAARRDSSNAFARYVRVERLGAGGMGEVWKAWDLALHRWVALKILRNDDPEDLARFRREAQTAAQVRHPNIAFVYEVGEAQGRHFIAMQYIQGETLASLRRDDMRLLAGLVRDASLAVHAAHEHGIIHRDLKPDNLMVETAGPKVYVMDFGLAKRMEAPPLSTSGHILGTPAYMAPEQARGWLHRIDARTDVYSLGATLYEVLTGLPPFQHPHVYELLRMVVEKEPTPPREIRDEIPPALEAIVLKCLAKDPARRYASALDLAEDLTAFLSGTAILPHPPSVINRLWKTRGRVLALAFPSAPESPSVLTVDILVHENVAILTLTGRLDAEEEAEIAHAAEAVRGGGGSRFVVDCSRLDYLSSAGVSALLALRDDVRLDGGDLRLAGVNANGKAVLDRLGIPLVVQTFDTVEAALRSFDVPAAG